MLWLKKKPIEIECPDCKIRFRLWVPVNMLDQWNSGAEIGCVKCGTRIKLERNEDSFHAAPKQPLEEIREEAALDKTGQPLAGAGEIILIVDDDSLVRKMAEDILKKNRFVPLTAQNGPEALDLIKRNNVAVIAVDLHLKNPRDPNSSMDGEEFLQKVVDLGKNIPAIITTGKDLIDDVILEPKWYDLHVKAFVQKGSPFWTDDLLMKIKEILKKD